MCLSARLTDRHEWQVLADHSGSAVLLRFDQAKALQLCCCAAHGTDGDVVLGGQVAGEWKVGVDRVFT